MYCFALFLLARSSHFATTEVGTQVLFVEVQFSFLNLRMFHFLFCSNTYYATAIEYNQFKTRLSDLASGSSIHERQPKTKNEPNLVLLH